MANTVDPAKWEQKLRALGVKGKLPAALTQNVIDAAQRRTPGQRYLLADGRVPGLALDVQENGSASFVFQYRTATGLARRQGIGSAREVTLERARATAEEIRGRIRAGADPLQEQRSARLEAQRAATSTVHAYLRDEYGPKVLAFRKDGGYPKTLGQKASGTYARISCAWAPLLDVQLSAISRNAIDKVLADRKDAGKQAGTLLRDWAAFRAMLVDAVDRGYLAALPTVRRPEPIRRLRGNQRVRYLGERDSEEECANNNGEALRFNKALIEFTCSEHGGGDFLRCVAGLALATGMRRGEIVRLTEKMINKRERRIVLAAEITKTNKMRSVFLSDSALAALDCWRHRELSGTLFRGTPEQLEDRITQREWPRLCQLAHVEDLHFHDLRHTFAVWLLRSCGSLAKVRDALGHSTVAQTEKYAHVADNEVREAVLSMHAS